MIYGKRVLTGLHQLPRRNTAELLHITKCTVSHMCIHSSIRTPHTYAPQWTQQFFDVAGLSCLEMIALQIKLRSVSAPAGSCSAAH